MLGIDLALIGSIVVGIPLCGYAIWKDMKNKPKESPVIVKQFKAEDGSIITITVPKEAKK
ncbi:MAG: hypothetical protein ACRC1P_09900 [Cellulosilyticaceae bacterium]